MPAYRRLDNLCVLVDNNNGQLDIVSRLIFPLPDLEAVFRVVWLAACEVVDATQYDGVFAALHRFKYGDRGRQAHGDCLPDHQGPRRIHEPAERAQGDHRRRSTGAGVDAAGGAAPRAAWQNSPAFFDRLAGAAGRQLRMRSKGRGRCISALPRIRPDDSAYARSSDRAGPARPAARQENPLRRQRAAAASTRASSTAPAPSSPPR